MCAVCFVTLSFNHTTYYDNFDYNQFLIKTHTLLTGKYKNNKTLGVQIGGFGMHS